MADEKQKIEAERDDDEMRDLTEEELSKVAGGLISDIPESEISKESVEFEEYQELK